MSNYSAFSILRNAFSGHRNRSRAWRECMWTARPGQILSATGAPEQGVIFPNSNRPGVMLAIAVRQYLNRYAVKAGEILTACDEEAIQC